VQDGDDGVHGDGEGSGSGDLLVLPAHALAVVQDEPAELVARLDALLQLGRLDRGGQVDLPEGQAPQDDAGDAEVHGPADVRLTVLVGAPAVQQNQLLGVQGPQLRLQPLLVATLQLRFWHFEEFSRPREDWKIGRFEAQLFPFSSSLRFIRYFYFLVTTKFTSSFFFCFALLLFFFPCPALVLVFVAVAHTHARRLKSSKSKWNFLVFPRFVETVTCTVLVFWLSDFLACRFLFLCTPKFVSFCFLLYVHTHTESAPNHNRVYVSRVCEWFCIFCRCASLKQQQPFRVE